MFNLLPKDHKFYDELEQLSDRVVSTAKQFESVVAAFPNFNGQLNSIEQDRLAARKIFGESLLRLDQAFITPLDREDILSLINGTVLKLGAVRALNDPEVGSLAATRGRAIRVDCRVLRNEPVIGGGHPLQTSACAAVSPSSH